MEIAFVGRVGGLLVVRGRVGTQVGGIHIFHGREAGSQRWRWPMVPR
jgi:hypothetical protein